MECVLSAHFRIQPFLSYSMFCCTGPYWAPKDKGHCHINIFSVCMLWARHSLHVTHSCRSLQSSQAPQSPGNPKMVVSTLLKQLGRSTPSAVVLAPALIVRTDNSRWTGNGINKYGIQLGSFLSSSRRDYYY